MRAKFVTAILLGSLIGCGSHSPGPKKPPVVVRPAPSPSTPPSTAPSAPETPAVAKAPRRETPDEADLQPPVESTSVIDLVEEGRLYRRALESYERGQMTFVEETRDHLMQDPLYQPLGRALEALVVSQRGDHDQALKLVEELSISELMQTESFVIAGEVFRQRRQLPDAIACLRNAVQRNPAHAVAHRWLAAIHLETGAMVLATEHFRAAANADSHDAQSLIQSGQIHFAFDGFESAVEDFRRALHRNLDQITEVEVRIHLAEALLSLDRSEEALETVERCDDIAAVLAIRGRCYQAQGNIEEATALADRALKESPDDRRAILLRSLLYMNEQHDSEAIPLLEKLVDNDSNDLEAMQLLIQCVDGTNADERADKLQQRVAAIQQLNRQVEELRLKVVDQPQDAELRVQMAELYQQRGQVPVAIRWYEAALGLDPTLDSVREQVERLKHPLLPPLEELPADPSSQDNADNRPVVLTDDEPA